MAYTAGIVCSRLVDASLRFCYAYRGTSLIGKRPSPQDHHRAIGIVLLQVPRARSFLVSEVPLYIKGAQHEGDLY